MHKTSERIQSTPKQNFSGTVLYTKTGKYPKYDEITKANTAQNIHSQCAIHTVCITPINSCASIN